jgi:hypothetical protein
MSERDKETLDILKVDFIEALEELLRAKKVGEG